MKHLRVHVSIANKAIPVPPGQPRTSCVSTIVAIVRNVAISTKGLPLFVRRRGHETMTPNRRHHALVVLYQVRVWVPDEKTAELAERSAFSTGRSTPLSGSDLTPRVLENIRRRDGQVVPAIGLGGEIHVVPTEFRKLGVPIHDELHEAFRVQLTENRKAKMNPSPQTRRQKRIFIFVFVII